MILVDTSVWIDHLDNYNQAGAAHATAASAGLPSQVQLAPHQKADV